MATQLLGGIWANRFGGKRVVSFALLWFSAATVLAPIALSSKLMMAGVSLPLLLLVRVLVGLGEGVVLPSVTTLLAEAVPRERRTQAVGGVFAGFHWRARRQSHRSQTPVTARWSNPSCCGIDSPRALRTEHVVLCVGACAVEPFSASSSRHC